MGRAPTVAPLKLPPGGLFVELLVRPDGPETSGSRWRKFLDATWRWGVVTMPPAVVFHHYCRRGGEAARCGPGPYSRRRTGSSGVERGGPDLRAAAGPAGLGTRGRHGQFAGRAAAALIAGDLVDDRARPSEPRTGDHQREPRRRRRCRRWNWRTERRSGGCLESGALETCSRTRREQRIADRPRVSACARAGADERGRSRCGGAAQTPTAAAVADCA